MTDVMDVCWRLDGLRKDAVDDVRELKKLGDWAGSHRRSGRFQRRGGRSDYSRN